MNIGDELAQLMMIPGLSGHEDRVRRHIASKLEKLGIKSGSDRMGNLIVSFPGDPKSPSVMVFTHMDQLGFFVRRVEENGLVRLERMGGVPEKALASQAVLLCVGEGRDVPGVILNKSHHATPVSEKYQVLPTAEIFVDAGFSSREEANAAGIKIGTPVVYKPQVMEMANGRISGTSIDDRAGCAVLMKLCQHLKKPAQNRPTIHLVFSVQEEFNLRGALVAAQVLKPDIAIQIDLMITSDTPDLADRGEMVLGGGPGMSLYSFHGRGTLNGVIPHPSMVALIENAAEQANLPLQRSAQVGIVTDLAYVQLVGSGVAGIEVGFPLRGTHSSLEVCDLGDLEQLLVLIETALGMIGPEFELVRN